MARKKNPGIYAIWDNVTGKVYVVSSVHLDYRRVRHFSDLRGSRHPNAHLQRAFQSYGESAFTFTIIEPCRPEGLIEREQFWIDEFRVTHNLYNLSPTAGNQLGIKRSEETKRRMSEALRGRKLSDESKRKMAEAKLGKKATPETRAKMSAAHTGNKYALGTKHSDETKKKLSLLRTGNKHALGTIQSEETKRKRADAIRRTRAARRINKEQLWLAL